MRFHKKALSIITCIVIVLTVTVPIYAKKDNIIRVTDNNLGISQNDLVKATPGIVESAGEPNTPGGTILQSDSNLVSPRSIPAITNYICTITNTYDGYIDRGDVASGTNSKPLGTPPDSLQVSFEHTVSNTISVSGQFPISKVETTVGYSGGWSDARTFTYVASVPPQTTVYVGYQDLYHVHDYDWEIQKYYPPIWQIQSGTGWSQQWYSYHFYSHY